MFSVLEPRYSYTDRLNFQRFCLVLKGIPYHTPMVGDAFLFHSFCLTTGSHSTMQNPSPHWDTACNSTWRSSAIFFAK